MAETSYILNQKLPVSLEGSKATNTLDTLTPRTDGWITAQAPHTSEGVFEQMIVIKHTLDATLWIALTAVTPVGAFNLFIDYKLEPNNQLILVPENSGFSPIAGTARADVKSLADLRMPYLKFELSMRPRNSATDSAAKAPTTGTIQIGKVKRY